jgi:dipeptidyl aminopeptidase/acylaminoacyl peptidase
MTAERWRVVDQILQGALICTRDHRDEFVAHSCGNDTALRNEVSSLLAVYDATPAEFLERPAIEEHGFSSATVPAEPLVPTAARAQPRRMVSARLVLYAAVTGIALGTVTGWTLAHSPTVERWQGTLKALGLQANTNGTPDAKSASSADAAGTSGELSLVVVNRSGKVVREIAANRPWTPRFSPDGTKIAYGAFGEGRSTSDIWITDLNGGAIQRLTDDDADSNDPQWSPDGRTIAYSVKTQDGKNVAEQQVTGGGTHIVASQPGMQFPTDWLHDGSALLVMKDAGENHFDILVQPANGSAARPYAATPAQETAGRVSPHTHWVAYTSNESGRDEVYVDTYPRPGTRTMVSRGGGVDPVWRGDGRELYYWRGDALIAVPIEGSRLDRPPVLDAERELFHAAYEHALNTMYDVSPNGERIVIVRRR